jgi:hypothetical protein
MKAPHNAVAAVYDRRVAVIMTGSALIERRYNCRRSR